MNTESSLEQIPADLSLRAARKKKGLSLTMTSALTGIDIGHISRAERGQAQLSVDALYRLACVLDMRRLRYALAPFADRNEQVS